MSLTFTVEKSPAGRNYLRTVSSGLVSAADVKQLASVISPGQPHHGLSILSLVEPGADFAPEARKQFGTMGGGKDVKAAVVVPSAPLRVMIAFIVKVAGAGDTTQFFATEAEAKRWLFEKLEAVKQVESAHA